MAVNRKSEIENEIPDIRSCGCQGGEHISGGSAGARLVLFGGAVDTGLLVGVGSAYVGRPLGNANANIGCRLSGKVNLKYVSPHPEQGEWRWPA